MSVGTPDYTRGVVNAQKFLGMFLHATTIANVTIPPNAETLVVVIPGAPAAQACGAAGLSTAAAYPAIRAGLQGGNAPSAVFFIDVSSATDPTVQVNIAPAAPGNWFIYADAGVHLTADIGGVLDSQGKHFIIPTIPAGSTFDHPPNELLQVSVNVTPTTIMLGAPGAGWRYRLFCINMACTANVSMMTLAPFADGPLYGSCAGGFSETVILPAQGYPTATNTALELFSFSGVGTMLCTVYYTVEIV